MTEQQSEVIVDSVEDEESRKPGFLFRLRAWFQGLTRRQRLLAAIAGVVAAIVLLAAILVWYLIFRQPITQLPGLNVDAAPVYSYSVSGVTQPLGIAVDEPNNRVYVTQSGGSRTVKVFDVEGNPLGELLPPSDGQLHTSTYVAVDPTTANVYVTDRGTNQLYTYDKAGKYLGTLKPAGVKSWGPLGITIDKTGLIYVGDANAAPQRVWVFKANGTVIRSIGVQDSLSYVNGIAVFGDGTVAVADSNHTQVIIYNADGTRRDKVARGEADAPMGLPRGMAIGAKDRLYVVDTTNDIVRVFKPGNDGVPVFSVSFGALGQGEGQFLYPNGVATDDHGHIYVTDRENNRWQVWTNR